MKLTESQWTSWEKKAQEIIFGFLSSYYSSTYKLKQVHKSTSLQPSKTEWTQIYSFYQEWSIFKWLNLTIWQIWGDIKSLHNRQNVPKDSTWGLQYVVSRISAFIWPPSWERVFAISSLNRKSPVCRTAWTYLKESLSHKQQKTDRERLMLHSLLRS